MIKYLGSKRTLLPLIGRVITGLSGSKSVIDLFSGTSRVGHHLKRLGLQVHANDHNAYASTLARCYVQADREAVLGDAERLIAEFNRLRGDEGYFTDTFCRRSRFFQPKNGARVDVIREAIARKALDPDLEAVLLVSLMEAADRVDSTTGVQMAYLKQWAARANNDLTLRMPEVLPQARAGKGSAHQLDALDAVAHLEADVAYIDPPYNQHKYLGNYHIWESLVLWDKPEVYGVACKRVDCRERGSAFNSRPNAAAAMQAVIDGVRARDLVVSFNNEGYFTREEMERMLARRGEVLVIEQDFKRYVGAQIGIYNPKGKKVGEVSHLRNTEYVYVVTQDASRIAADDLMMSRVQTALSFTPASTARTATPTRERGIPQRSESADGELTSRLRDLLAARASLSSQDAQAALGADAKALRLAFRRLMATGEAYASGVRRGTAYHWAGVATAPPSAPAAAATAPSVELRPAQLEVPSPPLRRTQQLPLF
jgi:adenine-specific DNA-methyltransferase